MKPLRYLSLAAAILFAAPVLAETLELLNVSYDPTRELYEEINALFVKDWKAKNGQDIKINQSHGGSGKQARAVIDGLKADVVTLALAYDIDVIAEKSKLLPQDWQSRLPNNSTPFTSTIVFLVHKGNPKHIKDWDDLIRSDVQVITPNPKTSGGARWNYLAVWGYASQKFNGDEEKIKEFVGKLYKNVPVLDTGARGSTTTFVQRGIGDVLVTWENEGLLVEQDVGKNQFETIIPSVSIKAEPPVALLDKNVSNKGTLDVATAYLNFLYTPQAQEIAAKHYFRPTDETVAAKYASRFPKVRLTTIADFGGWKEAQKKHFDDGGTFDQIYNAK